MWVEIRGCDYVGLSGEVTLDFTDKEIESFWWEMRWFLISPDAIIERNLQIERYEFSLFVRLAADFHIE